MRIGLKMGRMELLTGRRKGIGLMRRIELLIRRRKGIGLMRRGSER